MLSKIVVPHLSSQESPLFLRRLNTAPESITKGNRANIRAYNNSLAVSCVKADRVSQSPSNFSFNLTTTADGWKYHCLGSVIPPFNLPPCFLSVYIHDTDSLTQGDAHRARMPNLNSALLTQITTMSHDCSRYMQSLFPIHDWVTPINAPYPYRMIIHCNKRPALDHVCRYNRPQAS